MIVSDYIASFLEQRGIEDVFFIDGSACASLIVSVARNKNLNYFCPLHEQAGAFAVDGYFKASRKLSVMIATSGPAGQNLLNGVAASYYDSIPAIYITGQVNSRFMKTTDKIRQKGFQENDIVSMAKPITKYATIVVDPQKIRFELEKAFHIATSGRPGPILLDVPMDIQKAEVDPLSLHPFELERNTVSPATISTSEINQCLEKLQVSKRPVILFGGGVWLADANALALELAEKLKVPFFETWNMIDLCKNDFPYYGGRVGTFGGDGRNFGIQNSDFLLSIGSRISGRITGGMTDTFARAAFKVIVDIDEEELRHQTIPGDINIVADAKSFIKELLKAMAKSNKVANRWDDWLKMVLDWKKLYPVVRDEYCKQKGSVNPYIFVKVLSESMREGDVLVHEAGGNCVVTSQAFESKKNQRVFSNNGNSSLGYALPAAIGACVATKKPVVCIVGDGGFNFNIQELQTIKHYNLPIKIIIFNNYAYGITKLYRDTNFNSEYAGVDADHGMASPDFRKIARAYGIPSVDMRSHKNLRHKIENVLKTSGPVLCDVNMVGFYDYKPRLGWSSPIEDQYPFLPRDEFRNNLLIEPVKNWEDPVYPGRVG